MSGSKGIFMGTFSNLCFHLNGEHPGIYTELDINSDVFLLSGGEYVAQVY